MILMTAARINAVLRRTKPIDSDMTLLDNGIDFNFTRQTLKLTNVEYKLSSRENELLLMLIQNKNTRVEKFFILNKLCNNDSYFTSPSMVVYISEPRNYFIDCSLVEIINVNGKGFNLLMKD